jgi:TPP-dependent pyruvate/acetoin dehydrogenase alpha subunit
MVAPVVTATTMTTPDSKRIEADDPGVVQTTVDELAPLYRQMLAIRRME